MPRIKNGGSTPGRRCAECSFFNQYSLIYLNPFSSILQFMINRNLIRLAAYMAVDVVMGMVFDFADKRIQKTIKNSIGR